MCVCLMLVRVCAAVGADRWGNRGPCHPSSLCFCVGGWERWFYSECLCVCVSASEGGAIFKGCWEGNWSSSASTLRRGWSDPEPNSLLLIYSTWSQQMKECQEQVEFLSLCSPFFFFLDGYICLQTANIPHPCVFSWGSLSVHYSLFV